VTFQQIRYYKHSLCKCIGYSSPSLLGINLKRSRQKYLLNSKLLLSNFMRSRHHGPIRGCSINTQLITLAKQTLYCRKTNNILGNQIMAHRTYKSCRKCKPFSRRLEPSLYQGVTDLFDIYNQSFQMQKQRVHRER
jgi:hypothetical protein